MHNKAKLKQIVPVLLDMVYYIQHHAVVKCYATLPIAMDKWIIAL